MDVSDELRGRGGEGVGAGVGGKDRAAGGASQGPLVRDVVETLVLVAGGRQSVLGVLEGDGVRVLGDLSGETAGLDGPVLGCLRQLDVGDGRVIREQGDLGGGGDGLEVVDLHADDAFGGGVNTDAQDGACRRVRFDFSITAPLGHTSKSISAVSDGLGGDLEVVSRLVGGGLNDLKAIGGLDAALEDPKSVDETHGEGCWFVGWETAHDLYQFGCPNAAGRLADRGFTVRRDCRAG